VYSDTILIKAYCSKQRFYKKQIKILLWISNLRHGNISPTPYMNLVTNDLSFKMELEVSLPAGVIGIFHWQNSSDRTMVLGSTQSLIEMSTRSISWGKGGRCARLTTLPPSCAVIMKSGNLNFLEPSRPLQAYNGTALPFRIIPDRITTYLLGFP